MHVRRAPLPKAGIPLIVGIGASAGGLDAFKRFFANTPKDTGMAFVLVQHLSPDHRSMLVDLLAKTTAMEVIEAADGMPVKANRVFVIPPDATMTIAGGRLEGSDPRRPGRSGGQSTPSCNPSPRIRAKTRSASSWREPAATARWA